MKTKTDTSYGVIPYRYEEGVPKYLLIHQYSSMRDDTYWVFPKGHPDMGESGDAAAKRELFEETNLKPVLLDTAHPFKIEYEFTHDDTLFQKSVTFYLGEVLQKKFMLQEEEVVEAGWFTYAEARARITFENTKTLLDEAHTYLTAA